MKFGTWMSVMAFLAGIWVMTSPFIVGFAPRTGNPWTGPVLGAEVLGCLVALAALAGLVGFWGLHLKELASKARMEDI